MYYIKLEKRSRDGRQIFRSQKYLDKWKAYQVKELYCKDGEVIHLDYQYPNCKLIDYNNKPTDKFIVARKQPAFRASPLFVPKLISKDEYKMSLDVIFQTDDLLVYAILLSGLFDISKYDKEHIKNIPMAPYTVKQKETIVRYTQMYIDGDLTVIQKIRYLVFEMYEPIATVKAINRNKKNGQYYPYDLYEIIDNQSISNYMIAMLNEIDTKNLSREYPGHMQNKYYNSHYIGQQFVIGYAEHLSLF